MQTSLLLHKHISRLHYNNAESYAPATISLSPKERSECTPTRNRKKYMYITQVLSCFYSHAALMRGFISSTHSNQLPLTYAILVAITLA